MCIRDRVSTQSTEEDHFLGLCLPEMIITVYNVPRNKKTAYEVRTFRDLQKQLQEEEGVESHLLRLENRGRRVEDFDSLEDGSELRLTFDVDGGCGTATCGEEKYCCLLCFFWGPPPCGCERCKCCCFPIK
eukprot:TRINITY_DN5830_c0_g1_i1.p1 TRINITY_DN5830_c0_g1~~TRINITY_DN5830_c0_g1_i1.p1  ORF type:complete len:131 (-),score=46.44 TRINITY_DN5830_c0_g1_i1:158-550(-)